MKGLIHFFLKDMLVKMGFFESSCMSYPTLCNPMDCSLPGSSVHGDSLGKHTRVGCHALLQGIKPTSLMSPAVEGGFFTTSKCHLGGPFCSCLT